MKKFIALLLTLMLAALPVVAETAPAGWYEMNENVLGVHIPCDNKNGETVAFAIQNPETFELLTFEYDNETLYAASFVNLNAVPGKNEISFFKLNAEGKAYESRSLTLVTDENGNTQVESEFIGNEETDFRLVCNPENYALVQITEIYPSDDNTALLLQGCFGNFAGMDEYGVQLEGFDEDAIFTLSITDDARVLLPQTLMDPDVNVEIEDINAWYQAASELLGFNLTFHATFTMNPEGEFTSLEYFYLP